MRSEDGHCVFVGGLRRGATQRAIEDLFLRFGPVRRIFIAQRPPGFALVHFSYREDAREAVRMCNGRWFSGYRITVEMSHRGKGRAYSISPERRSPPQRLSRSDPSNRSRSRSRSGSRSRLRSRSGSKDSARFRSRENHWNGSRTPSRSPLPSSPLSTSVSSRRARTHDR
ncbi:RNA recognition motif domain containing protein-like [Tropilaelaps mercedesae]|uniref:RNA recognition motif domain containing protein-like n=1 Tax=Tropilaelaps mercedesae TaxID=418985 RepID=A0A1V9Y069_9ACAR|nr:RNA recognition motif domain containing protein-like [Tropilaelaps mercedesae]